MSGIYTLPGLLRTSLQLHTITDITKTEIIDNFFILKYSDIMQKQFRFDLQTIFDLSRISLTSIRFRHVARLRQKRQHWSGMNLIPLRLSFQDTPSPS